MSFCGLCGASLPTEAKFCGQCGRAVDGAYAPTTSEAPVTAATASSPTTTPIARTSSGLLIVAALLGLAAVATGIFLVTRSDGTPATKAGSSTIPGVTTVASNDTTAFTTIATDPVAAAAAQLQQLVAQDRPTADSLVGSWIPQLSAKRVGLKADGITYGPVEILADHSQLRTTYGAILVDAGAFEFTTGGAPMTDWFLTIVPEKFANKSDALKWCSDRNLTANVCLAREFKPPR